jgi:hypothetical protein
MEAPHRRKGRNIFLSEFHKNKNGTTFKSYPF